MNGAQTPRWCKLRKLRDYFRLKANDENTSASISYDVAEQAVRVAKNDFEYKPQKPDGSLGAGIQFKYDIKANKEV